MTPDLAIIGRCFCRVLVESLGSDASGLSPRMRIRHSDRTTLAPHPSGSDPLTCMGGASHGIPNPLFFQCNLSFVARQILPWPTGFHTFYVVHTIDYILRCTHAGCPVHALKSRRPRSCEQRCYCSVDRSFGHDHESRTRLMAMTTMFTQVMRPHVKHTQRGIHAQPSSDRRQLSFMIE